MDEKRFELSDADYKRSLVVDLRAIADEIEAGAEDPLLVLHNVDIRSESESEREPSQDYGRTPQGRRLLAVHTSIRLNYTVKVKP